MKRESLVVKKKMSGGTKVGITLLTLLVIVIVGLYLYGSSYYKQTAQVDRMITILQERNGEKLAEIVTTDDPAVIVTRESLTPLFSYIKENPSYSPFRTRKPIAFRHGMKVRLDTEYH
ncbi:hypothetical protein IK1_00534 [Bacillus cereus VD146]|uniref:TcaA second domain-containing protein n=1 Tax=Bacillus cereus (strain VD146) TaxID=1053236 RepID=R8N8T4_BACCX|nr:hypothetical protein IK1_00534 [Bacillus cereus VD146]